MNEYNSLIETYEVVSMILVWYLKALNDNT
jgi:hypothetical protein